MSNELIVVKFSKEQTATISSDIVKGSIEIQVEQSGLVKTWPHKSIKIKQGYIS